MNALVRPQAPAEWAQHPKVLQAQKDLRDKVSTGASPEQDDFPELWATVQIDRRTVKMRFEAAQHGLCAYCGDEVGGSIIELEHFRPRAAVTRELDPAHPGRELEATNQYTDRKRLPSPALKPGYWWLAYAWDNFVGACNRCNSWKGTLFPVSERGEEAPEEQKPDAPVLLNPFDLQDPLMHFEYDELGQIRGRTASGKATVWVCGLDRPSLTRRRQGHLAPLHLHLEELQVGLSDPDIPKDQLRKKARVLSDAAAWTQPFAALLRSVAAQMGLSWSQIEELAHNSG